MKIQIKMTLWAGKLKCRAGKLEVTRLLLQRLLGFSSPLQQDTQITHAENLVLKGVIPFVHILIPSY